jgi:beta-aspartyl-peptidase (threonine type)
MIQRSPPPARKTIGGLMRASCLILLLSVAALPGGRLFGESSNEGEIRSVLDRQVESWNRRDLEGFMSGYWESESLTFFSGGTRTSGWKATLQRYRNRYQSEGREMGHLGFTDIKIEMLGPKGAFVRGHWHLQMTSGEIGGLFTLIFRKFPAGWKIIHDHTGSES